MVVTFQFILNARLKAWHGSCFEHTIGGDKRIASIRAVGQAANVLTDEQRKRLVGTYPAEHKSPLRSVEDEQRHPARKETEP